VTVGLRRRGIDVRTAGEDKAALSRRVPRAVPVRVTKCRVPSTEYRVTAPLPTSNFQLPQSNFLLVNPAHHPPQFLAHLFDRMLALLTAGRLECRCPGTIFENPVAGEGAVLNLGENLLHLGLRLF